MYYTSIAIKRMIDQGTIWLGWNERDRIPKETMVWEPCGLDLHLDKVFQIWTPSADIAIDPSTDDFSLASLVSTTEIVGAEGFLLKPGQFVLAQTREYIGLASSIQAQIQGRSLLGRLGLGVHVTAPLIHAGFEGQIALELFNLGPSPIMLRPYLDSENQGLRIAQLCFHPVLGATYRSRKPQRFVRQRQPSGSSVVRGELTLDEKLTLN